MSINGGTITLASGDDGIHADATPELNGGRITISESNEGIEGVVIAINEGELRIASGDDGINVAGGTDG